MKKVLLVVLIMVGILAVVAVCGAFFVAAVATLGKERVPSNVILEADFTQQIFERKPEDPFAQLGTDDRLEILDVVDSLAHAAEDRKVRGLVARIGAGGLGLAHAQEIRDAVLRFRASGKPAIAFAETFGEFGPGNGGYYLATAFDEIYLQPSGDIGLTGLMYESPFVRGLLEKLEVEPRLKQRHEYKNAMNFYTHREYTEAHRQAMQELADSQYGQLVRGIAEGRGLDPEAVEGLFDGGPYLGPEVLETGLVDGLAYRDQVYDTIRERVGDTARLLYLSRYVQRSSRHYGKGETVALIYGTGGVSRGPDQYSVIDGSMVMGSDTVSAAIRAAVKDDRVRAILFRVDSPGGSYVASDTIWRETILAREAGKPVIVSMGNVAGSGGYFVAMDADKIVAQPGTITASIGVLGGKLLTRQMWDKIGVSWDDVHNGANSRMWTGTYDYDERGNERFDAGLDRIYEDFTNKVAAGREMSIDQVREIAKGRIWTGEDALRIGLVDELGGFHTAIRLAREAAGIEPDAPVRLKRYPRPQTFWEALFDRGADSSERAAVSALAQTLRSLQPQLRMLRRTLGLETQGPLAMPPGTPLP